MLTIKIKTTYEHVPSAGSPCQAKLTFVLPADGSERCGLTEALIDYERECLGELLYARWGQYVEGQRERTYLVREGTWEAVAAQIEAATERALNALRGAYERNKILAATVPHNTVREIEMF